jgi:DNA-binding PadR family transcriptional regulator
MLVVLGLLAERCEYAYEIEKRVKARRLRAWTPLGFSSIYALLNTAEKRGWATSRRRKGEPGPDIRAYRLTKKGRLELREAKTLRLSAPASPAPGVALALMFSEGEEAEALKEYAKACQAEAEDARRRLEAIPQMARKPVQEAIFARYIAAYEAEARWAEQASRILRKENSS